MLSPSSEAFYQRHWLLIVITLLLLFCQPAFASMPLNRVPIPLQPWVDWVLYGITETRCPLVYKQTEQYQCTWPSSLTLNVGPQGGEFVQRWWIDTESWLTLPGDLNHWPQQVRFDGYPTIVLERDGRPALKAGVGAHTVSGRFIWRELPDSLAVPSDTALLSLTLAGRAIAEPRLERDGRVRLQPQAVAADLQNHQEIRVFRKIIDAIPLLLHTRVELRISGQAREELLGRALPSGFIPLELKSPLSARLEADGRLRVQVKPGTWTVQYNARHTGPVSELSAPIPDGPWAKQEIWVFEARPALRVVTVQGAPSLDPAQTNLPEDWRQLPAYLMQPGQELTLVTRKRGDADPVPDRLHLERTLWLDFAGRGYTVQDRLNGTISRSARLEAAPPLLLGQVMINGQPQFITRLPDSALDGIEVRQGQIQLTADSRLEPARINSLPAVGWQIDPASLRNTINLPPGWRLLTALGTDQASKTWLQRWTLLDLFVVLIAALSVGRLWSWNYGALALVGLLLSYHEPNAPRLLWLNVLAAIALLRVLPTGRLYVLTQWYWRASWLALLVVTLAFTVQQVRGALYLQLSQSAVTDFSLSDFAPIPSSTPAPALAKRAPASSPPARVAEEAVKQDYDSTIQLQTGPGLPDWRWNQAVLSWNGPVAADQRLRLWFSPPWATRLWMFISAALLLALLVRTARPVRPPPKSESELLPIAPAASLVLALPLLLTTSILHAETLPMPSLELLEELRERLTEPPDCQPRCTHLATLNVSATAQELRLKLLLNSQIDSAIPLPLLSDRAIPLSASLDGQPFAPLFRASDHGLWARVPAGQHELELRALLPAELLSFQLPLPMKPGWVNAEITGWDMEGLYVRGEIGDSIQLTRQRGEGSTVALQPGVIPPFVMLERELILGVDWQVHSRVRRMSQANSAIILAVPLLSGERVTSPGVRVQNNQVLLNLSPSESATEWTATLDKASELTLNAALTQSFVEIWRLRASPLWHIEAAGLPIIHRHDSSGQWLPEWRPWPGESLQLTISRPAGIAGKTVTIDSAHLTVVPGQRATATTLALSVRSSRGSEQTLTLPAGAELSGFAVNGVSQPLRLQNQRLTLALNPGEQRVTVDWRIEQGISTRYFTPTVDLGSDSVNTRIVLKPPNDRWILFTAGPQLGPAVLFWGMLVVIACGALALGRYGQTPLSTGQWFLLGIGLSQAGIAATVLVIGWLLLLGRRKVAGETWNKWSFNLLQIGLGLLTLAALVALLYAINQGLLGPPTMQIAGNGSSAYQLQWYQDRSAAQLPQAWVLSVPLIVYRGLMLAWALWLAFALLRWLNWGWQCFSSGGIWRQLRAQQTDPVEG
ncbi:MAG: hypothetical protein V2J55_04010 [Candidatus Competibacteraceae bacterium]|nr:hypothetical protein [Candidatus Competibacteraceae bacterium]